MNKKLLIISLFALSGALITSNILPTPQYDLSGEDAVKCLIRNGSCFDCDLSNQDLRAAMAEVNRKYRHRFMFPDFSDSNLSGANLSGTDLSCATMRNTNLAGADLSGADLSNAIMTGADLSGANLTNTNLSGATNVNITGADITGANLTHASIQTGN
jgi:uncharacterized protein YjbI with pentapeptide repeats